MQIVSYRTCFHKKKKKKVNLINLSSAGLAHRVVKVNMQRGATKPYKERTKQERPIKTTECVCVCWGSREGLNQLN